MEKFEATTLRLKQVLGVTLDRDAAAALGLSPRAWAGRKKTGLFPETELYALMAKRPDLDIDVTYVLTGERVTGHAKLRAQAMASGAGQQPGNAGLTEFATGAIKFDAERETARQDAYKLLKDLADHCDDAHLKLLLDVARAFRHASVQVAKP